MTPEDYYLEQREQVHDDVVNLQEKALRLACKECGLTEEIDEFEVISSSDEIAKTAWYKGMYAKRVKFECSELNLTFFYDAYGIATYTYAGFSSNADTLENITKAFANAEQLRVKMDEIMERMIEEKDKGKEEVNCQEKDDKKTGFIGKKYSDTKFVFGEVRSQLDMETFEVRYVACAANIDLANYSLEEIYNQGAESKAKETVYVNRLCIFIHGKTDTGKTYTSVEALKQMGYKRFYDVRGYGPAKFRNINTSIQAILLDNWTDGKYMSLLLELCGDKPVKITHREKNNQYFMGDMIVVTSTESFEEWAKKCRFKPDQIEYLRSRFYICEVGKKMQIHCVSIIDRETKEQQQERLGKFMDFAQAYNKLIMDYVKPGKWFNKKMIELVNTGGCDQLKRFF